MALTSSQQAYKNAINSGNKADIAKTESVSMKSGWDAISAAGQQQLIEQSGNLWNTSAASGWGQKGIVPPVLPTPVDPYAEIKRQQAALIEAQKQARINALSSVKTAAMTQLGAEQKTIAPKYLEQRTGLGVSSQMQARSFDEYLAQRGLTSSGASAAGEIARNVVTQQGLTDIGAQEANAYSDIERRRTEAENAYQTGVAGAESETAATAAQNQINALMQEQSAKESAVASQSKSEFEVQMQNQKDANVLMLKQLEIQAQAAAKAGDYAQAEKMMNAKAELDMAQAQLESKLKKEQTAYAAKFKSSGGSTTTGGKVTPSTINTYINNYSKIIENNPYYRAMGYADKKAYMENYINTVNSKVAAGAMNQATADKLLEYVENSKAWSTLRNAANQ